MLTHGIYLECHLTLDPLFDDDLRTARELCLKHGFRVAELLMQKRKDDTPEQSKYDTFATGRGDDYTDLLARMRSCIKELQERGFVVRRYKIENIVLDSRHFDELKLLGAKHG